MYTVTAAVCLSEAATGAVPADLVAIGLAVNRRRRRKIEGLGWVQDCQVFQPGRSLISPRKPQRS